LIRKALPGKYVILSNYGIKCFDTASPFNGGGRLQMQHIMIPEEFFLPYTKKIYIKFDVQDYMPCNDALPDYNNDVLNTFSS
jgi:hypothetical protein